MFTLQRERRSCLSVLRRRRTLYLAAWLTFLMCTMWYYQSGGDWRTSRSGHQAQRPSPESASSLRPRADHPISRLMEAAKKTQRDILSRRTLDLESAARVYRQRRGRHPPPGFDHWQRYAAERDVVIIEEFWDLIYHDLAPFWAVEPRRIRRQSGSTKTIMIRGGQVNWHHDFMWSHLVSNMTTLFAQYLPDLDISLNLMDEARIVVPTDEMEILVQQEKSHRSERGLLPAFGMKTSYSGGTLSDLAEHDPKDPTENMAIGWKDYNGNADLPYWPLAVSGCPKSTAARMAYERSKDSRQWKSSDIPRRPALGIELDQQTNRSYVTEGFISNLTAAADLCLQPELEFMHGALVNPLSTSYRDDLIPLFSGSKLSVHSDITIPAPMHYAQSEMFEVSSDKLNTTTNETWSHMKDQVIWRGTRKVTLNSSKTAADVSSFRWYGDVAELESFPSPSFHDHDQSIPDEPAGPGP